MPDKFNELLLKQDIIELYNAGITPDYGYLMNGRFEKDMVKTLYSLKTLSGNPISWEASDTEYLFPVVSLEPKQAGTGDPSPENVRPISGYDSLAVNVQGKNLFNISKIESNRFITNNGDGSLTISTGIGTIAANTGKTLRELCDGISPGTYTINAKSTGSDKYVYTTKIGQWNFGTSKTLTDEMLDSELYFYASGIQTTATVSNIQLELGSTPTPYEPYQGNDYTLTLPETIYGGTVDAVTGVGEKTWEFVEFDGSEDERWFKTVHSSGRVYFYNDISHYGLVLTSEYVAWKCNRLVPFVYNYSQIENPEYSIGFSSTRALCSIVLENESMLSVDEFRAWLAENPVTVCYELATPEPFQATGNQALTIQPGNHTIYTDGNNISLSRKARRLEV